MISAATARVTLALHLDLLPHGGTCIGLRKLIFGNDCNLLAITRAAVTACTAFVRNTSPPTLDSTTRRHEQGESAQLSLLLVLLIVDLLAVRRVFAIVCGWVIHLPPRGREDVLAALVPAPFHHLARVGLILLNARILLIASMRGDTQSGMGRLS